MRQKLVLVFVPFILISAALVVGYTLLHWLLMGVLERHPVKEIYTNYWIPILLPWAPTLKWIRPRVRLLRFYSRARNPVFAYLLIGSFAMAAPIVAAQLYLETAAGKLTTLAHPDLIRQQQLTKFYILSHYYIDTANRGTAYLSNVSGKYSRDLNLHIYVACPIYEESMEPTKIGADSVHVQPDTARTIGLGYGNAAFGFDRPSPKAWCCLSYFKQISNRISLPQKNEIWRQFYEQTMEEFHRTDFRSIVYLEKVGFDNRYDDFKEAIVNARVQVSHSSLNYILEPKFDAFADRNGQKLPWLIGLFAIGAALWLIMIMVPPIDEKKVKVFHSHEIA
jgi:rhomboid protease GluP